MNVADENAPAVSRVLVVDDFDAMRMVIGLLLEGCGYQAFTAADGRTALDLVRGQRVDLAILDVNLPDMSGLHLYRELCRQSGTSHLPVIFISGRTDEALRRAIHEIPGARFLGKPLPLEQVQRLVREALPSPPPAGA